MNPFPWDDCYVTGEHAIDAQHERLVELINRVGEVVTQGGDVDGDVALAALDEMADYAKRHFADEEGLMARVGLDARSVEVHQGLHQAFVRELTALRWADDGTPLARCRRILDFLVHWLANHILDADKALVRQVSAIRAGLSPADAFEQELGRSRATLSSDPLLRALNGLFDHLSRSNAALAEANRTLELRVAERTAELAAANARLEMLVRTDPLTELPNRRHALERLEQLWAGAPTQPLTVLLIDVDDFKRLNDTFGHAAGDVALRAVARALMATVRTDDLVSRLGGDEFLAVLPATDRWGALVLAEHIRAEVARVTVGDGPQTWSGHLSIGLGTRTGRMRGAAELIEAADTALYVAKRGGRNCVATVEGVVHAAH